MFQDLNDIATCPAPLRIEDMGFGEIEGSDPVFLLTDLYDDLKELIALKTNGGGPWAGYMQEFDLNALIGENIDAFYESHSALEGKAHYCYRDLYNLALDLFARSHYEQAMGVFLLVASRKDMISGALVGLSACAVRRGNYKVGYNLALDSIKGGEMHPRVRLLAGFSAFYLRNKKDAKYHLALANRLARRSTSFRAEQRAAQRYLLLLQIG